MKRAFGIEIPRFALLFGLLLAIACSSAKEPDHIEVQHILISFQGKINKPSVTRTQEEAKTLAEQVLQRAQRGEDFGELVKEYTDDAYPGRYGMSNSGVQPANGEYPRDRMVPAFGNVGFHLEVGEVGMAAFDPKESPYGWHIIKRLK
jgi:hypothetical protein